MLYSILCLRAIIYAYFIVIASSKQVKGQQRMHANVYSALHRSPGSEQPKVGGVTKNCSQVGRKLLQSTRSQVDVKSSISKITPSESSHVKGKSTEIDT